MLTETNSKEAGTVTGMEYDTRSFDTAIRVPPPIRSHRSLLYTLYPFLQVNNSQLSTLLESHVSVNMTTSAEQVSIKADKESRLFTIFLMLVKRNE